MRARRLASRTSARRRLALNAARSAVAAAVAAGLLAGCGADYPDLMLIQRSGSLPDAQVEIVVSDGGTVRCDRGESMALPPRQLLDARDIVRLLDPELRAEHVYPRPANAQLRFRVETAQGEIAFSDTDGTRSPELARLLQLVREIAQGSCGLAR